MQLKNVIGPLLVSLAWAQVQQPITFEQPASIPLLGLGTWNLGGNTSDAVSYAIQTGYKHIDCAAVYGNEKEVGKGIVDGIIKSNIRREDLWITSKLWNNAHGAQNVESAVDQTLADLGLKYLDLYLMHWPVANGDGQNVIEYLDTWAGMEKLVQKGKVRFIGISNFDAYQISNLQINATIKPAVHQLELHPYLQQSDFVDWHKALGIEVTAYSPLANLNPGYGRGLNGPPALLDNLEISTIAKARGCTNAQVALAWGMARATSVIPKSQHADRILENFESRRCNLKKADYQLIAAVGKKYLKRFNNPSNGWGVHLYDGLEDSGY